MTFICLGHAYATLLRSESFNGIQYIKSFIKADKESIVTNETVDLKIQKSMNSIHTQLCF